MIETKESSSEQGELIRQLEAQFDQDNEPLKNALGADNEIYQEQRAKFIEMQMELSKAKEENEHLATKNESLEMSLEKSEEENRALQFDSVTGLRKRDGLYRTLDRDIPELLNGKLKDIEEMDEDELIKTLESLDPQELEQVPLSVMMSDVSFLSLANEEGHEAGDKLLQHIGEAARESGSPDFKRYRENESYDFEVQRHGGDEMTALIRSQDAANKALEFKIKAGKGNIPALEKYGLKPNLDVGVAHISEALEAFRALAQIKKEGGEGITKGERKRNLSDIWIAIADRRSAIQKGITRLEELKEIKTKSPESYDYLISFLRKGAFNTTDKELDDLIAREKAGEDWNAIAKEHIKSKETRFYETEEEIEQRRREIINNIADRAFE